MKIQDLTVKNCQPYAEGWQINAIVDGVESEMTFYHYKKADAIARAKKIIATEGRLPHEPYRG